MSDTTTITTDAQQAAPSGTQTDQQATEVAELGDAGKKALQAERARANSAEKAAKELKAQLDAIEASKLSDLERLQKENKTLADTASTATARALRFEVAAEHNISKADAEIFLTGSDVETLTAQAKRLSELSVTKTETRPGPRADLSQGQRTPPANGAGKGQLFADWLSGQRAG